MKFVWTTIAAALLLPTAASADFSVSKPKPKPKATAAPAATPAPRPTQRPPVVHSTPRPRPQPTPTPPAPTGIDPNFVNETLLAAGLKTEFSAGTGQSEPSIATTTGSSAWIVAFKDCNESQRCGQMEFYTLWRVTNEANVCYAWKHAVTNDPMGSEGRPTCYTLPNAASQLHLTMSSTQPPYTGLNLLSGDKAKARILSMLGTWTEFVGRLPEAYEYARKYCPRKTVKCAAVEAPKPAASGASATTSRVRNPGIGYAP